MRSVFFTSLVAITATLLAAAPLDAKGKKGECPGIKKEMSARDWLPSNVELTDDQKRKIAELDLEFQDQTASVRERITLLKEELFRLVHAENWDQDAIDRVVDETAEAKAAKLKASLTLAHRAFQVLTDEQRSATSPPREDRQMHCCNWRVFPGGSLGTDIKGVGTFRF
jgi:Spy/CpxP family protein refolding chaperone